MAPLDFTPGCAPDVDLQGGGDAPGQPPVDPPPPAVLPFDAGDAGLVPGQPPPSSPPPAEAPLVAGTLSSLPSIIPFYSVLSLVYEDIIPFPHANPSDDFPEQILSSPSPLLPVSPPVSTLASPPSSSQDVLPVLYFNDYKDPFVVALPFPHSRPSPVHPTFIFPSLVFPPGAFSAPAGPSVLTRSAGSGFSPFRRSPSPYSSPLFSLSPPPSPLSSCPSSLSLPTSPFSSCPSSPSPSLPSSPFSSRPSSPSPSPPSSPFSSRPSSPSLPSSPFSSRPSSPSPSPPSSPFSSRPSSPSLPSSPFSSRSSSPSPPSSRKRFREDDDVEAFAFAKRSRRF